ncbi:MAG TPA: hypothetical protein VK866_16210, partial [Acidimicrobiales bacterium]|nr:hypothetical protein [Acidimicrobiales bacterium]
APVVELATRRRRPAAWVGAAAAAVTAIVLVSVLPGGGDGDVALRDDGVTVLEAAPESAEDAAPGAMMAEGSDEADTGAPESDAAVADDADDDAEEATGGDGGDDSATESPDGGAVGDEATMAAPVYLGTLPDVDAVVERARSLARDAAATPPVEAVCPVPARTEALVLDATAQVAGVTYLVRVWSDGTAGGDIEVVDATDCALVLSVER